MNLSRRLLVLLALFLLGIPLAGQQAPKTGPETEKRFPPLQVPAGFKATLFACDPLIEYPSVIALGPRPRTLFVAVDYMAGITGPVTSKSRKSEIQLIEDSDGDGYADRAEVYAQGLNSIQGLAYHDGVVWAMHAPFLSVFKQARGPDGKPQVTRQDLLTGLGLPPEKNSNRLHCANGVVRGHDGWLYLALGDNGCDVPRPEGDRLLYNGGGILRCRPDGRDLHLFTTGLRNTYDVALDEDLNVFFRDNENDGGTYMNRVYHSFWGADHGYPYLYDEHPSEALPPLADLGRGSSAGGACYQERQFPAEFRGNLFFCEWGRAAMRYRPQPAGSSFAPLKEIEFAAGAPGDPYGFKPTDFVVDWDGSLLISDWADGQNPRRGRGRIYRVSADKPAGPPARLLPAGANVADAIARLDSDSLHERIDAQTVIERDEGLRAVRAALQKKTLGVRGRLHAVWIVARLAKAAAVPELLELARTDPEPRVQAQAIRAIGDLADPAFDRARSASKGDTRGGVELAKKLADLARGKDPRVLRETVIVVGRLGWSETPGWLHSVLDKPDAALLHAAQQALRRSQNWTAVLKLLDEPEPFRGLSLRALADRFDLPVVDGLIDRLSKGDPSRSQEYADLLTRVARKPGPYVYWGYRPAPKPANTVAWERTEAIDRALDRALAASEPAGRLAILRRMQRHKIAARPETLMSWLKEERQPAAVTALLDALKDQPADKLRPLLVQLLSAREQSAANRVAALTALIAGADAGSEKQLVDLIGSLEDGPVLAEALRQSGKRPKLALVSVLLAKLASSDPAMRAAAVDALAERNTVEAREPVRKLLDDKDAGVRRSAAAAAGRLMTAFAAPTLLKLTEDPDATVRRASLESLRLLREANAVPRAVAGLRDRETALAALQLLGELGGPEQTAAVVELARRDPSTDVLTAVVRALSGWSEREKPGSPRQRELERAVAGVQGASGVLLRWSVTPPLGATSAEPLIQQYVSGKTVEGVPAFAAGTESRLSLGKAAGKESVWLASSEADVPAETAVEFSGSAGGGLEVWLNGKSIHRREQGAFRIDSSRFAATLAPGPNRLLVKITASQGAGEFHLRFRRKSAAAEHEKLTQAALAKPGNAERGRKVFLDIEKSLCLKCHKIGEQGEKIGPDLTGVGSRYTPIYLVEALLEPSRTIAPSYETLAVALKSGKVLTGVKVTETDSVLTIADNQGQKQMVPKADIEERLVQPVSTMPEGIEKRLSADEFIDLIAFLVSQKDARR